jgi:hypothetical protein
MSTSGRAGWERVLADLEAWVDRAEALLSDGATSHLPPSQPWSAPEGLGPLPAELRDRVLALLERQDVVVDAARAALRRTGDQRRVTDRVGAATAAPRGPVYLDLRA